MHVRVFGPNLRDQSKGDFHVHVALCGDCAKYKGEEVWALGVESKRGTVNAIYEDIIEEGAPYAACRGSVWFAPCLDALPEEFHADAVEAQLALPLDEARALLRHAGSAGALDDDELLVRAMGRLRDAIDAAAVGVAP